MQGKLYTIAEGIFFFNSCHACLNLRKGELFVPIVTDSIRFPSREGAGGVLKRINGASQMPIYKDVLELICVWCVRSCLSVGL